MILLLLFGIPLLAAVLSSGLKLPVSVGQRGRPTINGLAIVAAVGEAIVAGNLVRRVIQGGLYQFTDYFAVDAFGAFVIMLTATVGLASALYAARYVQVEMDKHIIGFRRVRQFYILFHLFMAAMFVASAARNLLLLWVAIEATTLSSAFLISFYNKPSATEAAWKYLIINSVALLISFFGTMLFLATVTHTAFGPNGAVNLAMPLAHQQLVKIAFVLVLIGYGTKVGLAPLHTWLPDAHPAAPPAVSALLSGALINVAWLAVLRFKTITDVVVGSSFSQQLLVVMGVISIVVAALMMVIQQNYKRLFAYSTIEHTGLMALGFGFGGAGVAAALWHMLYHTLTKTLLFLVAGNISLKYNTATITKVRGLLKTAPVTAVILLAGAIAITGLPPLGLFITEFSILAAGFSQYLPVVIITIIALAVVFAAVMRHSALMVFGEPAADIIQGEGAQLTVITPLVILLLLLVLSVWSPAWLTHLLMQAAAAR